MCSSDLDPIGLVGGMNLYVYVGGNPVNAMDLEGLWTLSIASNVGIMCAAIGGGGGTALNFGYSEENGFSMSITGTIGYGAVTGIGTGVGITILKTNASSVDQLLGKSVEGSRFVSKSAISIVKGNGYIGQALTIAIPSVGKTISNPGSAAILTDISAIIQWEQSRGWCFLKDESTCN